MEDNPKCTKCNLYKTSCASKGSVTIYNSCLPGYGNKQAKLMFIGEAFGAMEVLGKEPFLGKIGSVLDECLKKIDIKKEDIYFTNTVHCRPPMNIVPNQKYVEACSEYLEKEIAEIKPEVIVLLGSVACQRILGRGDITRIHGRIFKSKQYNAICVPLYHPAFIIRKPEEKVNYIKDFINIKQLLVDSDKTLNTKHTNFIVCDTIEKYKEFLKYIINFKEFSFDLETSGFDYTKDKVLCMGFSCEPKSAFIIPFYKEKIEIWKKTEKDYIYKFLDKLFQSERVKVAQNLKFDWHFLKSIGIGFKYPYKDTLLMDYLIDENRRGQRSLGDLAYTIGMGGYDANFDAYFTTNKIKSYEEIPDSLLWEHNANDCDCTMRVYNLLKGKIKKENLELVLDKITLPLLEVLLEMESQGVNIDLEYAEKLKVELEKELKRIEQELLLFPEVTQYVDTKHKAIYKEVIAKYKGSKLLQKKYSEYEYTEKYAIREPFNFKSPNQLKVLLFDVMNLRVIKETDKGSSSTDSSVLEELQYESEFCKKLLEYRKIDKIYSTYVSPVKEMLQADGKIHTQYQQAITLTGRLCIAKGTLVDIVRDISKNPKGIPIENIKCGDLVYTYDENKNLSLKQVTWAGKTGTKEVIRIYWKGNGNHHTGYIDVTPEHLIRMADGDYKQAKDLKVGSKVLALHREIKKSGYALLYSTGNKTFREQRFIYETLNSVVLYPKDCIHHINHNKLDNRPENLQKINLSEHSKYHSQYIPKSQLIRGSITRCRLEREGKIKHKYGIENPSYAKISKYTCIRLLAKAGGKPTKIVEHWLYTILNHLKNYCINWKDISFRYGEDGKFISKGRLLNIIELEQDKQLAELKVGYYRWRKLLKFYKIDRPRKWANQFGKFVPHNHRIIKIEFVNKLVDVYDIEVEGTNNFIANEICVHNSSASPNLQNLPKGNKHNKDDLNNKVRAMFKPSEGCLFLEADFSQLEFRCFAAISKDAKMIEDIKSGKDIHSIMAAQVNRISLDQVTPDLRKIAKSVVFALLYGSSVRSVAKNVGIPEEDAYKIANGFMGRYTTASRWMDQTKKFAELNGYVINNFGRKRRLLDINSTNRMKQSHAKRQAINSPVQGMASDVTSITTVRVFKKLKEYNLKSRIIMTIHDALLLEVYETELEQVKNIVKSEMERPIAYVNVPLEVSIQVGKNWGEMEDLT